LGVGEDQAASRERGLQTWQAYHDLVVDGWAGQAGEPTAPGWAGAMFLWRVLDEKSWLFDRESLQPLIASEAYVQSLDLMVRTHDRYQTRWQTPQQVWSGVTSGTLRGGIGFPLVRRESAGELLIHNLPGGGELGRVLLDPFSTVISLSAQCRQSTAAKRFIQWISGGEGSGAVRQQVWGLTDVRSEAAEEGRQSSRDASDSGYDRWLADRLSSPVTVPGLQLLRAGEYYAALDGQVGRALGGEASAADALAEAARQWQDITSRVGVDQQKRAWRRAQGSGT
jgi:hypothetical protein